VAPPTQPEAALISNLQSRKESTKALSPASGNVPISNARYPNVVKGKNGLLQSAYRVFNVTPKEISSRAFPNRRPKTGRDVRDQTFQYTVEAQTQNEDLDQFPA